MSWVWEHSNAGGNDRLVLLAIADSADQDGSNAWPAVSTIARKCRVSERTVQRSIRTLVELGELVVKEGAGGHRGVRRDRRPNRYELPMLNGATPCHPVDSTGCQSVTDGVSDCRERGDNLTPNPALDPSLTRPSPDADFEQFWQQYPMRDGKRVGKQKALDQWRRLSKAKRLAALNGVGNYADSGRMPRDAHRWLRDGEWVDWQTPATRETQEEGMQYR